jgi:valyl-tRNA synthetase
MLTRRSLPTSKQQAGWWTTPALTNYNHVMLFCHVCKALFFAGMSRMLTRRSLPTSRQQAGWWTTPALTNHNHVMLFCHVCNTFFCRYVKDADKEIIANIKAAGRLVDHASLNHSYPFCWRSDTPLIYRAVPSWFVKVGGLNTYQPSSVFCLR